MKKILIITYYWPPAGGPGVQRILKFVKYLQNFGWQSVILTVHQGEYYAIDVDLTNEIPNHCIIYKTKILEPYGIYRKILGKGTEDSLPVYILNSSKKDSFAEKISKWIRVNLFIPDPRVFWLPFAVSTGKKIIEEENIDLIFTSSPPHTVQLIGKRLSKKTGKPWVADFRDPWTDAFWFSEIQRTQFSTKINKRMENTVLNSANALTFISKSLFSARSFNNKYFIIPNGYDPDDFKNIERKKNTKFTITFVGNLSRSQYLDNLIEALISLDSYAINSIIFKIYGNIHDELKEKLNNSVIKRILYTESYTPHKEFVNNIVNSDLLLLVIPKTKHNKGIVTGKIFEYLATPNYILGIGPKNGDAAKILADTNHGKMFDYDEPLDKIILDRFKKWRKNDDKLKLNTPEVEKYSRSNLTARLVDVFNSVLNQ